MNREKLESYLEQNPFAKLSDVVTQILYDEIVVLDVPQGDEVRRVAPLGTIFEDATLLFFDCVVSELMRRTGNSEEDMRNRHAIWV